MKLRFTPRSIQDIAEIGDYIRARNPGASRRVRDAILDSLQNLTSLPYIGRKQTLANVRKLVVRKYPYLIYYTVDETAGEIVVISVRHPSRQREYSDA